MSKQILENIELKKPGLETKKYMIVPFETKSFSEDETYFYFEGYLSTFGNEDRGGDIVMKGAFDESLKVHTPSLLGFHKDDEPPLGVFDSLVPDEKGLFVKGRMPKGDSFVTGRIMPQMKIGALKSMSIGYSVWGDDGAEYQADGYTRHLKRVFLWEGSLVNIPMNEQALIKTKSAVPYQDELPIADRGRRWDSVLAVGRVRDWSGAEDGGLEDPEVQAKYKKAFLWFDEANADLFGAYKLPIADIIDDQLTVIPRAVFAAAAAMQGARGGVYLPTEDRPRIMRTIEKYYEKIGLDSPFGKTFRIDDIESLDVRTLEKLLHIGVRVSKKSSKMLVSFIKAGLNRDDLDDQRLDADEGEEKKQDWSSVLESIKKIST